MSAADVDAYVAALSPTRAERVGTVVAAVRRAVPDAAEAIEYNMPYFRRGTAHGFGVADRAGYISLYIGQALADRLRAGDPTLRGGKGCLNVRDTQAVPIAALVGVLPELFDTEG